MNENSVQNEALTIARARLDEANRIQNEALTITRARLRAKVTKAMQAASRKELAEQRKKAKAHEESMRSLWMMQYDAWNGLAVTLQETGKCTMAQRQSLEATALALTNAHAAWLAAFIKVSEVL